MTIVCVAEGKVEGKHLGEHVVWRGIPYARAPLGELRWRAPAAPEAWHGIRLAHEPPPRALQPSDGVVRVPGSEDCLYLNVCVPDMPPPDEGWPVLFWVHGGDFRTGGGLDLGDGQAIAAAGIAVVTINYRLGALGFLHLGGLFDDAPYAGVCGLLDQIAALRWVRDNIAAFGGDSERVTVYGQSAGGKSVGSLMGSPLARGLFTQVVVSSGGADFVAPPDVGTSLARWVLAEVDVWDMAGLRALPGADVLAAQERVVTRLAAPWVWRPTVHAQPIESIGVGNAAGVRTLVGSNGAERWGVPTRRLADAQSEHAPVWRYRLDAGPPGFEGVHGVDLPMVWRVSPGVQGPPPARVADQVHHIVTSFVRGGEPPWPCYDRESRAVLVIDETNRVEADPSGEERQAWTPGTWF